MKKKPVNKRPILRWLLRLSLIFLLLILLLASATYFFIKIKYPAEEITRLLKSELSHALNDRPVQVGRVSLNPFQGFIIEDISIYDNPEGADPDHEKTSELSIEKLYLKYNLLSLFKRTIHINEIRVESPYLLFSIDENGETNFDDILMASESDSEDTAEADSTKQNLPINISLNKFAFENLSVDFGYGNVGDRLDVSVSGFSVFADDIFLPRGGYSELIEGAQGKLRIQSLEAPWELRVLSRQLESRQHFAFSFDTAVNLTADGLKSIMLIGNLRLSDLLHRESLHDRLTAGAKIEDFIDISLRVMMDMKSEYARAEHIDLFFADQKLLSASGDIKTLLTDPFLSLKTDRATIKLSNILDTVKKIIPTSLYSHVDSVRIAGNLEIEESLFSGWLNKNEWSTDLRIGLNEFSGTHPASGLYLNGLNARFGASGGLDSSGIKDGQLVSDIRFDNLIVEPSNSVEMIFEGFDLSVKMNVLNGFFPSLIQAEGYVENLLGAELTLDIAYDDAKPDHADKGEALLTISHLNLDMIPEAAGYGVIDGQLQLHAKDLGDIGLNVDIKTDSLTFELDEENIVIAPLNIYGTINSSSDTTFEAIRIRKFDLFANDFLSIHGNALIENFMEDGFQATVDSAVLRHKQAFNFLPSVYKRDLQGLEIDGITRMAGAIEGKLPAQEEPMFMSQLDIDILGIVDYPEIPLRAGSIDADLHLLFTQDSAGGDGVLKLDDFVLPGTRDVPLNSTILSLNFEMPEYKMIRIEDIRLSAPELHSRVNGMVEIDSLETVPFVKGEGVFRFSSADSILIVNDLFLNGDIQSDLTFDMISNRLGVQGILTIENTDLFYTKELAFRDISGSIGVHQNYDVETGRLVNDEMAGSLLTDLKALNYHLMAPYYDEKRSQLKIGALEAYNYTLSDIRLDVYLGDGKLEIPAFSLKLYDGNMSGNIAADLQDGQLEKAQYHLKANIARLNSAKMVSALSGSKASSELNMNMEIEGIGLDPETGLDFRGFLYITKIGSKFTENLLNSLDPKKTDKSIQDTKRLLKWGYKPKLISVEIKHGYMYPSIHLVKGNVLTKLIPLNLSGGKIELARIPVKFFLEM